jgi:hypothetical protein
MEAIYEVAKQAYDSRDPNQTLRLDRFRQVLEPYLYHYLIEQHSPLLNTFWTDYVPPTVSAAKRAFVIVERRPHPNFAFILKNTAWADPANAVYLFCSDANLPFIKALLGPKEPHFKIIVAFQGLGSREEGKADYNRLLTSARFYEQFDHTIEHIVTVQMDAFFRRKLPNEFYTGDYWGNPWAWRQNLPGGGGITVRRLSKMIAICTASSNADLDNEDAWISDRIIETGSNFPPIEFRREAIMESLPAQNPYCLHQFWTFLENYMAAPKHVVITYWTRLLSLT